jgi:Fe-Mn family superoxide dismutase
MTEATTTHPSRRDLLAAGAALAAAAPLAAPAIVNAQTPAVEWPKLPYADDALSPVISSVTISFHYGKHHRFYYDNMIRLVAETDLKSQPLLDVIKSSMVNPARIGIFNNAAQFWNHSFYWNSLSPKGGGQPTGAMKDAIEKSFKDYDTFKRDFAAAANGQFASGWAWLVADKDKKLSIQRSGNADTPVVRGFTPLLTIDVWEHAYYLDYHNRRADYTAAVIDRLLNWEFAAENLSKA